jgi:hypothetical protein
MTREELAAAQIVVDEVRALFDDLDREMERRVNFEIALLRTSPQFRRMLRELVDYAAARPQKEQTDGHRQQAQVSHKTDRRPGAGDSPPGGS